MSSVNIKRAVDNIKSNINVYSPIVEVIVNAIQAIENKEISNGHIEVVLIRSNQIEADGSIPPVESIKIIDNGIGFNDVHRNSFDTLYSDLKIEQGGKGFGRFICLKYFENFYVESVYNDNGILRNRKFSMGKGNNIIVNEKISETAERDTGSIIHLSSIKSDLLNKKISTIGKIIVEKLLPYFIARDYTCPTIKLTESDASDEIILNDYLADTSAVIKELELQNNLFTLGKDGQKEQFEVRVFKLYHPKNQRSKISLVAHKREVVETSLYTYIPEFVDDFCERSNGIEDKTKNYIIKSYVFSKYLDENVSLERAGFNFPNETDLFHSISQHNIESKVAEITKELLSEDFNSRFEKKTERVNEYVKSEAPWHKSIVNEIDLKDFPYNPSNEEIEALLQKEKYKQDVTLSQKVAEIMKDDDKTNLKENVSKIVGKISESNKNELIHYIALRRRVLELFKKSLEIDANSQYSSEGVVHDIIFPRKKDSEATFYDEHNLWIIDERLNFTDYISSDLPLNGGTSERPDLLIFDNRVAFRGDNESSNPVTIFEFKKPNRDDFVNLSSKEDPVEQIIRYVNNIREGNYKTPEGRKILIAPNTPFYGYVICDLTSKVEKWLNDVKDFDPMPDRLGWFRWFSNINLYIEVLSWDKILKDANMRNKIFFHKLGIE